MIGFVLSIEPPHFCGSRFQFMADLLEFGHERKSCWAQLRQLRTENCFLHSGGGRTTVRLAVPGRYISATKRARFPKSESGGCRVLVLLGLLRTRPY